MREEYSISELCEALKISRSGYYVWLPRTRSLRAEQNLELKAQIRAIHGHRHMKGYGSPRMTRQLRARGFCCSVNRGARLMREEGIKAGSRARMNSSERLPAPVSRGREILALSIVERVKSFFESFLRRVIWTHSRKDSKNSAIIMGQPT